MKWAFFTQSLHIIQMKRFHSKLMFVLQELKRDAGDFFRNVSRACTGRIEAQNCGFPALGVVKS